MTDSIRNDVKYVTRYAMGYTPKEEEIPTIVPDAIPLSIGIEKGIRTAPIIKKVVKDPKGVFNNVKTASEPLKGKPFKTNYETINKLIELKDLEMKYKAVPKPTAAAGQTVSAKALREYNISKEYDNVRKLLGEAKNLDGKNYTAKMKEVYKAIADANAKIHAETVAGSLKPVTWYGKAWQNVKKYTGLNKLSGWYRTASTKSPALRTFSKFARTNALAAVAIDVAFSGPDILKTKETFDKIDKDGNPVYDENGNKIPGREGCGTEKALKQTGRVLVTAGAQLAAFTAGAKAGAAVGAAIGSVIPGAGTVAGAVIGGIAGIAMGLGACYLTGKGMEHVVGKSELQQLKDKQENEPAEIVTDYAMENSEDLNQVLQYAKAKYLNEGEKNEDFEKSYNNIVEAYNNGEIARTRVPAEATTESAEDSEGSPEASTSQTSSSNPASGTSATGATEETGATGATGATEETSETAATDTEASEDSEETSSTKNFKELRQLYSNFINTFKGWGTPNAYSNYYSPYQMPMTMQFSNYGSYNWTA